MNSIIISFIGIIVGVLFFVLLSYKGNNLAVSSALGALVIILFNLPNSEAGVLGRFNWLLGAPVFPALLNPT